MPQSHPTTGPVRFLSPVRFIARKARNFTSVLLSWSNQTTGPVRLDTAVHFGFGQIFLRTPRVPRTIPVRASYERGRESSMFFIPYGIRTGPHGTRKRAVRHPYGQVRELTLSELSKIPHGPRIWWAPVRAVHGLITISLPVRAHKLIMHA